MWIKLPHGGFDVFFMQRDIIHVMIIFCILHIVQNILVFSITSYGLYIIIPCLCISMELITLSKFSGRSRVPRIFRKFNIIFISSYISFCF